MQLCLLCLGIVGTVSLSLRLGLRNSEAALAGVFVVATPAVLAMATTAMPDIAALALGVCAMERLAAWNQTRRWTDALAGTVLLAGAILTRIHLALLLIPAALILFATKTDPRERSRRMWVPLAGA